MKIKHIQAIPLVRKLDRAFQGGTYRIVSRNTIVTRVELDNGIVGETFGGDEEQYQTHVVKLVNEHYRPLLVGQDVRDVERHWQRMWDMRVDFGNRGIHTLDLALHCIHSQAVAAVDIALWDALGKALGQSVWKLLGGYRDRVPVIAIGGYMNAGTTAADLEREVSAYLENGIGGLKLKVGKNPVEQDIERARLVRRVAGERFWLCVDANQAWAVEDAVAFARGARDLNLKWIEEPCRWNEQWRGNARVREAGVPVCVGQGEISRQGCRDLLLAGAVDMFNVDVTIAAGVTEWRRIAGMAACFGVGMAHHEEAQVALHLLAAVPHGLAVEIFPSYERDPMWQDLPAEHPVIKDGYMHVPHGPGFGMPLNQEVIERYAACS